MCLNTVEKWGRNESGYGYKAFQEINGKLYSPVFESRVRPRGEWLQASWWWMPRWLRGDCGWYIYTTLEGAQEFAGGYWSVYRVQYKHAHKIGTHSRWGEVNSFPAVVASEMLILDAV